MRDGDALVRRDGIGWMAIFGQNIFMASTWLGELQLNAIAINDGAANDGMVCMTSQESAKGLEEVYCIVLGGLGEGGHAMSSEGEGCSGSGMFSLFVDVDRLMLIVRLSNIVGGFDQ